MVVGLDTHIHISNLYDTTYTCSMLLLCTQLHLLSSKWRIPFAGCFIFVTQ